ncbi:MAG: aminoacyl-histidine dipeptidase [Clostridia bacterium]|nr:aminoacyl-histidine dipeptidase [Clostridia bacterium]
MLENCAPRAVFSIFEELCALPHPSRNTAAATDYCLRFAKQHGLAAESDAAGNVVIRKPATPGKENAPTVILQGHLDMVAEKEPGHPIDFDKDGLSLFLDGDLIGAHGTTLGGDDGVAVAMVLAILADDSLAHPAIEAVFTTDEEIGMLGAEAMDMSGLRGKYMINIDSEEEGVLTVSCAGGAQADIRLPVCREAACGTCFSVVLEGMSGGHSGAEIHKNRANADRVAAMLLAAVSAVCEVRLVSIEGGTKDNAIPCRATCCFYVSDATAAEQAIGAFCETVKATYAESDPGLSISYEIHEKTTPALTVEGTRVLQSLLLDIPCGVQKMSTDIPGLVQTSLNLGILQTAETEIHAVYSVRSSVGAEKSDLLAEMRAIATAAGASFTVEGEYPAWEYKRESPLRDTVVDTYRRLYGADMRVEAIHAGLECGLFSDRIPGLECVSLGPNMQDIHTTRERLSVSSVRRTYEFVCAILAAIV